MAPRRVGEWRRTSAPSAPEKTTATTCRQGDVIDLRSATETLLYDGNLRRSVGEQGRRAVPGDLTRSPYGRPMIQIMADAFAARDRSPRSAGAKNA